MDCVFCKIIAGDIPSYRIWEDDSYLLFLDIHPIRAGHSLLIPKQHIDDYLDLDDTQISQTFTLALNLARKIRNAIGCKRVGLAIEGLSVPHFHIHLVPVNKVNDLNPSLAKTATPEELQKSFDNMKKYFN